MKPLTEEQQKLLDFIVEYKRQWNGNSPSFRQMMAHMGYNGTGRLLPQFNALTKAGAISYSGARGIIIPNTTWDFVEAEHADEPVYA